MWRSSAKLLSNVQDRMRIGLLRGHIQTVLKRSLCLHLQGFGKVAERDMAEEVLGIQCFVNDVPGFSGVLKHR